MYRKGSFLVVRVLPWSSMSNFNNTYDCIQLRINALAVLKASRCINMWGHSSASCCSKCLEITQDLAQNNELIVGSVWMCNWNVLNMKKKAWQGKAAALSPQVMSPRGNESLPSLLTPVTTRKPFKTHIFQKIHGFALENPGCTLWKSMKLPHFHHPKGPTAPRTPPGSHDPPPDLRTSAAHPHPSGGSWCPPAKIQQKGRRYEILYTFYKEKDWKKSTLRLGHIHKYPSKVLEIKRGKILTGAFYVGNFREWSISSLVIIPETPSNPSIPYVKRTLSDLAIRLRKPRDSPTPRPRPGASGRPGRSPSQSSSSPGAKMLGNSKRDLELSWIYSWNDLDTDWHVWLVNWCLKWLWTMSFLDWAWMAWVELAWSDVISARPGAKSRCPSDRPRPNQIQPVIERVKMWPNWPVVISPT